MAAAEAEAARQHTANHSFVQEDVRRAPKFSCSPSSSFSKSESDGAPDNAANGPDHPSSTCIPDKLYSGPPTNIKWWLNLQPHVGPQKDFTYEQLNALETELEVLSSGFIHKKSAKISEDHQPRGNQTVMKNNNNSYVEKPWEVSTTCKNNEHDTGMQEFKDVLGNDSQRTNKKDLGEFWYLDDKFTGLDSFNCLIPKQAKRLSSDLGSNWVGAEKAEPWWRSAGQDGLASLVAQKSLEHIENCDLPRPLAKHFRKGPSTCTECFECDESLASSLDKMVDKGFSGLKNYTWESPTTDHSLQDSDQLFSNSIGNGTSKDEADDDPSKTKLLEALCHSQTRAREAEKAAQEAYAEKEHIITLFFRQASQLFAYKQWFQLLQLENLYFQLKNKNQPITSLFPVVLPWVPHRGRKMKKGQPRVGKRKRCRQRNEIRKYAVAFAVGLGLASAGLLLGWTMGWLFPPL
ncbi:hypothetical protein FH972_016246 [Carpinus fangiana]|uniref:Uncharacterized protein n=1 Tax=Carpinus fangiana TaxID=176857 RepID=A0A5N6RIT0_9ROSI|nr:hypothetical protein FH972_016246 [Carpinus fangiana]KAE8077711.1 hypothetical protein FH972_016246 [Carpinus fangiana]